MFLLCQIVCIINDYSYLCTVSSHQASQRCSNAWGFFVYIRLLSKYANGKILTFKYHIRVHFLILVSYFTPQRWRFYLEIQHKQWKNCVYQVKKQQNVASETTQKCFLEQKDMTCNNRYFY